MANCLKVAKVSSILELHERGWSQRRIARELGVSRGAGGEASGGDFQRGQSAHRVRRVKRGQSAHRVRRPRRSRQTGPLRPKRPPGRGASASRSGSRSWRCSTKACRPSGSFRTWSRSTTSRRSTPAFAAMSLGWASSTPLPFRRMEVAPGEEAQIDFGKGAPVIDADGRRRRTHVLRVVLSHSRRAYSEVVHRQTTDDFIRCLENAFVHFGGVPKTLVPDNLKAAVLRADWYDPDLNPKLQSFCEHYGTVLLPTKPRTPRHKGKVERGVDYVQENALKGRTFRSLEEQNAFLLHWESTIADTRIHGTTRKQVLKVFEDCERAALAPLPLDRFPCYQEAQRKVSRDGHLAVSTSVLQRAAGVPAATRCGSAGIRDWCGSLTTG